MFGLSILVALSSFFGTTVSSSICADLTPPTFTTQNATTQDPSYTVSGTTSPNASVTISDNGQVSGTLTSDNSGDFSLSVALTLGSNQITSSASTSCQNANGTNDVTIFRESPPTPPNNSGSSSSSSSTGTDLSGPAGTSSSTATSTPPVTSTPPNNVFLQLQVPDSSFTSSGTTVTSDSVFISGTTNPGAVVVILNDNVQVAKTNAASDGTFGVSVPLHLGANSITIKSTYNGKTTTQNITYTRVSPNQHKSSHKTWWIIGLIILVMLIIGVIIWLMLRKKGTTGNISNEIHQ